jgi:hypothetical protein
MVIELLDQVLESRRSGNMVHLVKGLVSKGKVSLGTGQSELLLTVSQQKILTKLEKLVSNMNEVQHIVLKALYSVR